MEGFRASTVSPGVTRRGREVCSMGGHWGLSVNGGLDLCSEATPLPSSLEMFECRDLDLHDELEEEIKMPPGRPTHPGRWVQGSQTSLCLSAGPCSMGCPGSHLLCASGKHGPLWSTWGGDSVSGQGGLVAERSPRVQGKREQHWVMARHSPSSWKSRAAPF